MKIPSGRSDAPLFLAPQTERALHKETSQRRKRAVGPQDVHKSHLVDAVIDGERAHLYVPAKEPLEKEIQIRIVTTLSALGGVRVMQHRIFPCHRCGALPAKHTGLGEYAADILCIVQPHGRACFVEVKRPSKRNAKRDANQRAWAEWIRKFGGVAGIATNEAEAVALVEQARVLP
jgi:hypothetical protein